MSCPPQEKMLCDGSRASVLQHVVQLRCNGDWIGLGEHRPQGRKRSDSRGWEPWSKQPMAFPVNGQYGEITVKDEGSQRKTFKKVEAHGSRRKRSCRSPSGAFAFPSGRFHHAARERAWSRCMPMLTRSRAGSRTRSTVRTVRSGDGVARSTSIGVV